MAGAYRRHLRTIILAVLATVAFVAAAILSFDVQPQELLTFFLASVLLLVIVIALAFCATLFWRGLRRWFGD